VGEDGKPIVYTKAKLGDPNKMYYNEEVRSAVEGEQRESRCQLTLGARSSMPDAVDIVPIDPCYHP
jgi:hypothetical protein